jgi:hypothetical protein
MEISMPRSRMEEGDVERDRKERKREGVREETKTIGK